MVTTGGYTHPHTFTHSVMVTNTQKNCTDTRHEENSGYDLHREEKIHGICLCLSNIAFGKKTCKNFRLLYLYCLPQHCLRDVSKSSEKHKWTMVVSRPLIQLEIIESFKFTSLTVTHKRIIIHVERIIQFEITNCSLPTFSVELTPIKAVWHTWKYQSFGYLRLNNSTYTQKRAKIS